MPVPQEPWEAPPADEYFLTVAEKIPEPGDWIVLCPAPQQLHLFHSKEWSILEDVETWIEEVHFKGIEAFSGQFCPNEVDYDMHGVVRLEYV